MHHDEPFDPAVLGYRVLGAEDAPGYIYSRGEPAAMETGQGLLTAPRPFFEFDPLERVGRFLHLGGRVRRLRVPPGATVERSKPMSQGGCYTWRSDRVELLDILPDLPALMREYDATGTVARQLHLSGYLFPEGFRFPERVEWLTLSGCLATEALELPARLERLVVFDCALKVGRVPEITDEFVATDSYFEGVEQADFGPAAAVQGCTFRRR